MDLNSAQICRLCLENSEILLNIFENCQRSITIASILTQHFWFEADKNDGLSEWLCETCWINVKAFHNFYKRIEYCHGNYRKSIKTIDANSIKRERSDSSREAVLEPDLNIVKCEETQLVLREAELEPDLSIVKCEGTQLEVQKIDFLISRDDSCDYDNSCNQSEITKDSDDDDSTVNEKSKNDGLGDSKLCNIERKCYNVPTQQEKDEQDAQIREFFTMKCNICSDTQFKTLLEARKHYRHAHKKNGYLICCDKRFYRRCKLMDHIRSHTNPGAYRCDQCDKRFNDRLGLKYHMTNSHAPRKHKCSVCSRTFKLPTTLEYHVQSKHSSDNGKTIPCDTCNKGIAFNRCHSPYCCFRSKLLLVHHIRNVHNVSLKFFCEVCARKFKTKHLLQQHISYEHSATPPPKTQCDICGAWLKHLRTHLKKYHNTQNVEVECPICNRVIQNKDKLRSHIKYTHGDRNHKCVLCDKAFKAAKNLKEHVALHTGEDLYSCQYCEKTFKSNANMYKHRKNVHAAEWTRDNTKRQQNIKSNQKLLRETDQVVENERSETKATKLKVNCNTRSTKAK